MSENRLAGLVLGAAILSLSPAARAAGFFIRIEIPAKNAKTAKDNLAQSESAVEDAFGSRPEETRGAAKNGNPVFLLTVRNPPAALSAQDAGNFLDRLKRRWGPSTRISLSPLAGASPKNAPRQARAAGLNARAAKQTIHRLAPRTLPKADGRAVFDGQSAWRGAGSLDMRTVEVFAGTISRGAARAPRIPIPVSQARLKQIEPPSPVSSLHYPYAEAIEKAGRDYGIDPEILGALIAAKSGFNPDIRASGLYGLTGMSKRTFAALGFPKSKITDPETNIMAGAKLLSELLRQFHGNLFRALAAYQSGPEEVLKSGGIPNDESVRQLLAAFELAYRKTPAGAAQPAPREATLKDVVENAADSDVMTLARLGCGPIARYTPIIDLAAKKEHEDPDLMRAIICQENPGGSPTIKSSAGAIGIGQLMPSTARNLHVDPTSVHGNILGVAKLLHQLRDEYNGNIVLMLAAYNGGGDAVDKDGKIRYSETRNYVKKVTSNYRALTGRIVHCAEYMTGRRLVEASYDLKPGRAAADDRNH
ncbi:MAG: lytic transglycosylase domain-containing protein [Elusimicrobiota bacterium]